MSFFFLVEFPLFLHFFWRGIVSCLINVYVFFWFFIWRFLSELCFLVVFFLCEIILFVFGLMENENKKIIRWISNGGNLLLFCVFVIRASSRWVLLNFLLLFHFFFCFFLFFWEVVLFHVWLMLVFFWWIGNGGDSPLFCIFVTGTFSWWVFVEFPLFFLMHFLFD